MGRKLMSRRVKKSKSQKVEELSGRHPNFLNFSTLK